MPAIQNIGHDLDTEACKAYATHVDREVKFISNSIWDYGCYVKTVHGWVDRDNINETELRTES